MLNETMINELEELSEESTLLDETNGGAMPGFTVSMSMGGLPACGDKVFVYLF